MNYKIAPEFTLVIDAIETHLVGKKDTIALSLATFFARGTFAPGGYTRGGENHFGKTSFSGFRS